MTSRAAAMAPLTVPLGGVPCVYCGQPARALAILTDRRAVVHQARIPHCSTPITGDPESHARRSPTVLRPTSVRPVEPTIRSAACRKAATTTARQLAAESGWAPRPAGIARGSLTRETAAA
jgi:hypothetical protein